MGFHQRSIALRSISYDWLAHHRVFFGIRDRFEVAVSTTIDEPLRWCRGCHPAELSMLVRAIIPLSLIFSRAMVDDVALFVFLFLAMVMAMAMVGWVMVVERRCVGVGSFARPGDLLHPTGTGYNYEPTKGFIPLI